MEMATNQGERKEAFQLLGKLTGWAKDDDDLLQNLVRHINIVKRADTLLMGGSPEAYNIVDLLAQTDVGAKELAKDKKTFPYLDRAVTCAVSPEKQLSAARTLYNLGVLTNFEKYSSEEALFFIFSGLCNKETNFEAFSHMVELVTGAMERYKDLRCPVRKFQNGALLSILLERALDCAKPKVQNDCANIAFQCIHRVPKTQLPENVLADFEKLGWKLQQSPEPKHQLMGQSIVGVTQRKKKRTAL